MSIIINPGTGNVYGADLKNATANMDAWVAEIPGYKYNSYRYNARATEESWAKYPDMARGRFTFDVVVDLKDGRHMEFQVEMPGLPIESVRYTGRDDQNIWDFPRLYVDGSSWVWAYSFSDFQPEEDE